MCKPVMIAVAVGYCTAPAVADSVLHLSAIPSQQQQPLHTEAAVAALVPVAFGVSPISAAAVGASAATANSRSCWATAGVHVPSTLPKVLSIIA